MQDQRRLPENWLQDSMNGAPKNEWDLIEEGRGGDIGREALAQGARGVASMAAAVPDLLAVPFSVIGAEGPEKALRKAGEGIREGAYRLAGGKYDPETANLFSSKVGQGIGSAAGFIGGGGIARGVSKLVGSGLSAGQAAGLVGAMQSGPSQYFEAKAMGANEGEALTALAIGSGAGWTERYGVVGDILGKLDRRTGGGLRRVMLKAFSEAGEEGAQEMLQGFIQDTGAKLLYDEEREILSTERIEEGGVGAIVGMLLGGAGAAVEQALGPKEPGVDTQVSGKDTAVSGADSTQGVDSSGIPRDPMGSQPQEAPQATDAGTTVSGADTGRERVLNRAVDLFNQLTGLQSKRVETLQPYEEAATQYLRDRGVDAVFIEGDENFRGMEVGGVVLLPANNPQLVIRKLVRHELFHTLDPAVRQEAINRTREAAPDLFRKADREYRRGFAQAQAKAEERGAKIPDRTQEQFMEEAAARETELLTGILDALEENPSAVTEALQRDPGWVAWIAEQVRRVLSRLGLIQSPEYKRLAEFIRTVAADPQEARFAMSPAFARQAVDAGQILSEALRTAEGRVVEQFSETDPKFAAAYHGSPHDFDKFSTEKIGTGEGIQAYGHGLYFASKRGVAEWYRDMLSPKEQTILVVDGQDRMQMADLFPPSPNDNALARAKAFRALHRAAELSSDYRAVEAALSDLEGQAWGGKDNSTGQAVKAEALALLRSLPQSIKVNSRIEPAQKGRLYQVNLAPAEDEYLLWDEPLSGQSAKVREALAVVDDPKDVDGWFQASARVRGEIRKVSRRVVEGGIAEVSQNPDGTWLATALGEEIGDFPHNLGAVRAVDKRFPDMGRKGEQVYQDLVARFDAPAYAPRANMQRLASQALLEAGIRGIKYRDGTSRGSDGDSYNYVIFDEGDVSIEAKFAVGTTINVDGKERPTVNSDGRPIAATEGALRAFWRWFGDSKVVDEDGRPRVVYHGTNQPLTRFDLRRGGSSTGGHSAKEAIWFTDSPEVASEYADLAGRTLVTGVEEAEARNERFKREYEAAERRAQITGDWDAVDRAMEAWENAEIDDIRKDPITGQAILPAYLRVMSPLDVDFGGRTPNIEGGGELSALIAEASRLGLDGVKISGIIDSPVNVQQSDHYAVFRPEQIKSATGANGAFSGVTPDIRFAVDPSRVEETQQQAFEEGEDTEIGGKPYRRAVESEDPTVRAWMRALDEQMRADGKPDPVSRAEQQETAERALARDYDGQRARLKSKMEAGDMLLPWEMKAASAILSQEFLSPDPDVVQGAIEFGEMYRDNRTEVARALGVIRDAVPSSPEEHLADMLSWRSRWIELRMSKAEKRSRDLRATEGQREKARQEIKRLRALDARKHADARKKLEAAGYPPDLVAQSYFTDFADMAKIARIIGSTKGMAWDKSMEWRYVSMLSNPTTWARNSWGNAANILYQDGVVRMSSALANLVVRDENSPTFKEQAQYMRAVLPSLLAAGKAGLLAWRTGLPVWEVQQARRGIKASGAQTKIETAPQEVLGSKIFQPLKKLSTHMLVGQDEFAKAFVAASETAALAYRAARNEGLSGKALETRVGELMQDYSHPIHQEAYLEAKKRVFQAESGDLLAGIEKARTSLDRLGALPWEHFQGLPWGTILFPFIHTPAKIFETAYGEAYSPVTALLHMLGGKWKGDKPLAVRDIGHALPALAAWSALYLLVFGGDDDDPAITGSGSLNRGERDLAYRTNRAPYTFKTPLGRISYRNFDPAATSVAAIVDTMEAGKEALRKGDTSVYTSMMAEAFAGIVRQAGDRTYLRTLSDIVAVVNDAQREGMGTAFLRFAESQATSLVPNIARGTARATDPFYRERTLRDVEQDGVWDDFLGTLYYQAFPSPGRAPAVKHDIWGRPIRRIPVGLNTTMSVLLRMAAIEPQASNPALKVDQAILRYNQDAADPYYPSYPATYTTKGGERHNWTDEEYSELVRISGTRALEILGSASIDYQNPTEKDMATIRSALRSARSYARNQILAR